MFMCFFRSWILAGLCSADCTPLQLILGHLESQGWHATCTPILGTDLHPLLVLGGSVWSPPEGATLQPDTGDKVVLRKLLWAQVERLEALLCPLPSSNHSCPSLSASSIILDYAPRLSPSIILDYPPRLSSIILDCPCSPWFVIHCPYESFLGTGLRPGGRLLGHFQTPVLYTQTRK